MVYTRVFLSLPMMMMMMMSSLSSGLSSKSTSASTPSASHLLITTSPSQLQLNEAVCDASHLLVVATLDGHIHGINAASGSLLWRVQDEAWGPLVRVSSPVFTTPSQSKLRRRRRTSSASFAATATSLRQSALPYPSDALFPLVQDDNDADGEEDDSEDGSGEEEEESFVNLGTFVPEASGDGQLYQLSADNVLKKLPMSMKNIVENHPIYVSENLIYTSKKLSKLIALDPVSGKVVRTYGDDSSGDDDFSSAFLFDELNSDSIIFIGRTQYIVKIQDKHGKYRWNITYSEFTSTNPISMLTKDQLYSALKDTQGHISTSVDGKFLFKDDQGNILWENHFEYPVSCAFRVVKHPDLKTRFSLLKVYPLKKPRRSSPYINSNPGPGSGTLHSPPSQQQQSYMGLMDGSLFTLPTRYFEIDYNTPLISAGSSSSVEIIENGKAVLVSVDDGGAGYGGEEGEVVNNDREIIHGVTACAVGTPGYPNCLPFTIDPPPSPLPPSYSSTSLIDIIFDASSWNGQTMASAILTLCTIIITFILLSRKLFSKGLKARNSNTAPILDEKEQAATTTTTTATQMVSENKQGLPVEDEKGLESITAPLLVTTTSQTTSTLVFSSSLSPSSSSNESSSNPTAGSTSTPSSSRGGSGGKEVAIDEKNNMASSQVESLKSLEVSDIVLGYGSHGTVVYKGKFSNRPVAIKRLLLDFYSVAENEVKLLQDSDHHPNIVRYYFQETTTRFMYIALELSPASIHDVIEKRSLPKYMQIATRLKWKVVMNMILRGLRHLHHLNIVHRDIKPQNILIEGGAEIDSDFYEDNSDQDILVLDEDEDEIFKKYGGGGGSSKPTKKPSSRNLKDLRRGNRTSPVSPLPARPLQPPSLSLNSSSSETLPQHQRKKEARPARHPRVFISDFGLCKKLADDQSSFHHTVNLAGNGGGTVGWRAPEILAGLNDLKDAAAKEEQERELEKERLILLQNKKHQQRGRTASSGSGSSTSSAKSGRIPVVVPAAAARGVDVDYRLPERDDEGREEEEGGEEEEEEEDTAANRDSAGGLKVPLAVGDGTSETYTLLSPNNPTLKVTKKIDIFAAGCVFYYILSGGEHPFGDRYMREMNIVKGNFKVEKCSSGGENDLDEEISESKDLIKRMIAKDPKKRPDASTLLTHPFFWTPSQRLSFLQDVSDRFEKEERDPPSSLTKQMERGALKVIGADWCRKVDRSFLDNLGKYRKYDGGKVVDLLRAMRNKKHHYADLPPAVQKALGSIPNEFLNYFTSRFPLLFMHCHTVVVNHPALYKDDMLKNYFEDHFQEDS